MALNKGPVLHLFCLALRTHSLSLSTLSFVVYIHSLPYTPASGWFGQWMPQQEVRGMKGRKWTCGTYFQAHFPRDRLYLSINITESPRKQALQFSSLPASSNISLLLTLGLRMEYLAVISPGSLCSPVYTILTGLLIEPTLDYLILTWHLFPVGTVTDTTKGWDLMAKVGYALEEMRL